MSSGDVAPRKAPGRADRRWIDTGKRQTASRKDLQTDRGWMGTQMQLDIETTEWQRRRAKASSHSSELEAHILFSPSSATVLSAPCLEAWRDFSCRSYLCLGLVGLTLPAERATSLLKAPGVRGHSSIDLSHSRLY